MKRLLHLTIACLAASLPLSAQDKILWNGEYADPLSCGSAYGTVLSGADAHAGSYYFRAEPDNSHSPRLGFKCSGAWRSDISGFDELRFFIKSNLPSQKTSVRFTTYFAAGKWVDLSPYLVNGEFGTDYQEIAIPLDSLKTATYDLSSIEYIEFSKSNVSQVQYFIDDILVADLTPPVVRFEPVSQTVARLLFDERFDTTQCYEVANYELSSPADPDYLAPTQPVRIGRHNYVTGLLPVSGTPVVHFELLLIFDKPLKNGHSYALKASNLGDPSGNETSLDTTFTFSDLNLRGNVKSNQVGYLPDSPKLGKLGNFLGDAWFMPVDTINPPDFQVLDQNGNTAFTGKSTFLKADSTFSGELVFDLDFSSLTTAGQYYIYVPGYGRSEQFVIHNDVYNDIYQKTAKDLYYQRADQLAQVHAGPWARNGLPATTAEIHASQSLSPLLSPTDPGPGTMIPMTGGWLDAGDYGRYVPTAVSALFILFTANELYPQKFPDNHLNIPESGNQVPDILDEAKYETDWLHQMQAPDGGVYFRVTPAKWSTGLPEQETNTLFVSEKTTQATAMFAAGMAMAHRNFKKYFPEYAELCLQKAIKAWEFLQLHPQASAPVVVQGISAGPYPDPEDRDNRAWAAAELYKSTGEQNYHLAFQEIYAQIPHQFHVTMSWQQHTFKAAWAYATTTFPTDAAAVTEFKNVLETEMLPSYLERTMQVHAYHGAYHPFKGFIGYGTFGMAQSYAFDYILFSYLLNHPDLLDLAKIQLDIPLGNNPLSRTFITGVGAHSPRLPLHWSTISSKYPDPVPGVPVFGPAASLVMNRPSSFAIQDSLNRYPYGFKKEDPYPVLRRYTDAREAVEMSEFTVQEIAVTAAVFAFFSSVSDVSLPVRLQSFTARPEKCQVVLNWSTSEEVNAAHFLVERSSDARNFQTMGKIHAAGDSRNMQTYTFTDSLPSIKNYYRLKQVDRDGQFEYSDIRFAATACRQHQISLANTSRNTYELTVSPEAGDQLKWNAHVYSMSGAERIQLPVMHAGSTRINCANLLPGIYILRLEDELSQEVFTGKLLIY